MKKALTRPAVARLPGASVGSVSNRIYQGRLKAGRTPGGHRRIGVDDQSLTRRLAEEIKEAYPDCEVLVAHDGFAAGEMVGARKPQAGILGLRMPGMDGNEVCSRIKSNEDTKGTAVMAITAHPSAEAKKSILYCGARECLTKPLDLEVLPKELGDALAERG